MTSVPPWNCKYCGTVIPVDRIVGHTAICANCGLDQRSEPPKTFFQRFGKFFVLGLVVLVGGFLARKQVLISLNSAYAIAGMTEAEVVSLKNKCLKSNDNDCLIAAFQRLSELNPTDFFVRANWAFQLTFAKRYQEADAIYKSILADGQGTYDFMAYYADNLVGLNQISEAITWYERSLGIKSNLIDVTQKLATLYNREKRPLESVSLLSSFVNEFPQTEGRLAGDIAATLALVNQEPVTERIRLIGLSRGQFAIPLSFEPSGKPLVFLVDTGATIVTMPTQDILQAHPDLIQAAKPAKARLADGRTISAQVVRIPSLHVGEWAFQNIEVLFCETCSRLAGMNLLKNLKMETVSKGDFYTLTLTR